ncbi:MAG: dienelactone hydrolase family protein [Rhodanobacteraceae bacterium]
MPLSCVEIETTPHPTHAVIWLHGLGADGHDFEPIVPQLVAPSWPPLRFVFPHAPVRSVTINGGARMRAWYDIAGADIAARQDADGVRASIGLIDELIAREGTRGIGSDQVLLAGFSQGGAIALAAGLRHATRLAGVIALSSYLPLHETTASECAAANADLPIFMGHGSHDPVVPESLGELSRDVLRGLGHDVEWHSYAMAHQVCAEEVADLRVWLGSHLVATRR